RRDLRSFRTRQAHDVEALGESVGAGADCKGGSKQQGSPAGHELRCSHDGSLCRRAAKAAGPQNSGPALNSRKITPEGSRQLRRFAGEVPEFSGVFVISLQIRTSCRLKSPGPASVMLIENSVSPR